MQRHDTNYAGPKADLNPLEDALVIEDAESPYVNIVQGLSARTIKTPKRSRSWSPYSNLKKLRNSFSKTTTGRCSCVPIID